MHKRFSGSEALRITHFLHKIVIQSISKDFPVPDYFFMLISNIKRRRYRINVEYKPMGEFNKKIADELSEENDHDILLSYL